MTIEEIYKTMRDKADAKFRERERIINFIEMLEDGYRSNGEFNAAKTCRGIVDHLRHS